MKKEDENATLKAEVERWKDEAKAIEVLMLMADGDRTIFKARAEKAEAELDAARPLLEAIACLKGLDFEELDWPTISIRYNAEDYYWHLRAAKEKA